MLKCTCIKFLQTVTTSLWLKLSPSAPSTIEIPPQSITVNETDTATFTCSVDGVPLPSITWTLPNGSNLESLAFNQQDVADEQTGVYAETIISNETPYAAMSVLNIMPVSRGDAGVYICTAVNRLANASSTAILTVQGKVNWSPIINKISCQLFNFVWVALGSFLALVNSFNCNFSSAIFMLCA